MAKKAETRRDGACASRAVAGAALHPSSQPSLAAFLSVKLLLDENKSCASDARGGCCVFAVGLARSEGKPELPALRLDCRVFNNALEHCAASLNADRASGSNSNSNWRRRRCRHPPLTDKLSKQLRGPVRRSQRCETCLSHDGIVFCFCGSCPSCRCVHLSRCRTLPLSPLPEAFWAASLSSLVLCWPHIPATG